MARYFDRAEGWDMTQALNYGHHGSGVPGVGFIDAWGNGPLLIRYQGKEWWFEFSEMFGPLVLRKSDLQPKDRQPVREDDPFWEPFERWMKAGRKTRAVRTKRGNRVKFHLCHIDREAPLQ